MSALERQDVVGPKYLVAKGACKCAPERLKDVPHSLVARQQCRVGCGDVPALFLKLLDLAVADRKRLLEVGTDQFRVVVLLFLAALALCASVD